MKEPQPADFRYSKRTIVAHTLQSAHLAEERTLKVYLPPGYDEQGSAHFPVVYCHDGLEFFTHGRIATICNQMILEGKIQPIIVVGIAVQMSTRTADYAPEGARHLAYTRFVVEECLPLVESVYRVEADTAHRWMAGISLGAAASLSIHLQHPDLFRRLLLFSGAFYETITELIRDQHSLAELQSYMVVGRQETAVKTAAGPYDIYRANQTMRALLEERGASLAYKEADGTHIWGFWQRELAAALYFMDSRISL